MPRPRLALLLACTLLPLWSMPAHALSDGWVPIGSLQGSGEISAKVGGAAMVEGVVTGSFSEGLGGFFLLACGVVSTDQQLTDDDFGAVAQ